MSSRLPSPINGYMIFHPFGTQSFGNRLAHRCHGHGSHPRPRKPHHRPPPTFAPTSTPTASNGGSASASQDQPLAKIVGRCQVRSTYALLFAQGMHGSAAERDRAGGHAGISFPDFPTLRGLAVREDGATSSGVVPLGRTMDTASAPSQITLQLAVGVAGWMSRIPGSSAGPAQRGRRGCRGIWRATR